LLFGILKFWPKHVDRAMRSTSLLALSLCRHKCSLENVSLNSTLGAGCKAKVAVGTKQPPQTWPASLSYTCDRI
jgi:hypothetical protein